MKKYLYILISFLAVASGCALQSDVIYIDDRVDVIEEKMAAQRQVSGDTEKLLRKEYARLNNRVETLNEKFRLIEGRLEEIIFALESQKEIVSALKTQSVNIDSTSATFLRRIKHLESYTGYEPSYDEKSQEKTGQTAIVPRRSKTGQDSDLKSDDFLLYTKAKKAFDKNDLKKARTLFSKLIKRFPGSDRADNAQFWIGETYYKSKWYQKAILEYQKVIDDFPESNKIAAAYLKQGLAFAVLGEKENAEIVLKEMIKKFPDSGEAVIARKKLARKMK